MGAAVTAMFIVAGLFYTKNADARLYYPPSNTNTTTFSGALFVSSTLQATGVSAFYQGIVIPGGAVVTQAGLGIQMNLTANSASTSLRFPNAATSSLNIANQSSTTLRVIGETTTSTIFVSTTASNVGSSIIFVTTNGASCVQMYVSNTIAVFS